MKYNWILPQNESAPTFSGFEDYHPIIFALARNIGLENEDQLRQFLFPTEEIFHDPFLLADMDIATEAIIGYAKTKNRIFVHGDFDVDGISATSILWDFLYRKMNADVLPIIPNRFDDGYGLSENTLNKIIEAGGEVVITVDCGIKDTELIKRYPNLKFIITDHHTFPTYENGEKVDLKSDNLIAAIHPQHPRSKYPFIEICGATVAWKLICALNEKAGLNVDTEKYLDLVGMATVTDIMPLKDENRLIVRKGLHQIKNTSNLGLRILKKNSGISDDDTIDTYHLGFVLGPRINASGRMEDALQAVRLFTTQNENHAEELSKELNQLNIQRQEITQKLLEEAIKQVEMINEEQKLFFIHGEDWPEGILGLIAGKIQEKYSRPVLVSSFNPKSKIIKGSARSFAKYHITQAFGEMREVLTRFGGHAQAAGFSLEQSNLEEFKRRIVEHANQNLTSEDLVPNMHISKEVEIKDISEKLVDSINLFAPFGYGNPYPVLLLSGVEIQDMKVIGKNQSHVKLKLFKDGLTQSAIAFNSAQHFKDIQHGDKIDIVGSVKKNIWNGNTTIDFDIKDFKKN